MTELETKLGCAHGEAWHAMWLTIGRVHAIVHLLGGDLGDGWRVEALINAYDRLASWDDQRRYWALHARKIA